jgi:hypothetical protein
MKALWLSLGALVCLSATVLAQGQWTRRTYDRAQEISVHGTVVEVRDMMRAGTPHGTYLMLQTPTNSLQVHLGPSRFVTRERKAISPGDNVQVVGCLVNSGATTMMLAREIHKAGSVVTYRNAKGFFYSGPRRAP